MPKTLLQMHGKRRKKVLYVCEVKQLCLKSVSVCERQRVGEGRERKKRRS
jgi:hypothetical protein